MRKLVFAVLAGSALLLGANAAAAQSITIAIGSEPTTLDPQVQDDGGERAINDNIYETLMRREADGTLVPGLAAEMPVQVDAVTWEFKLREGVRFSNGEAFDANAVVYSVERVLDPALNSEQFTFYASIGGVEKVDALTVRIATKGPDLILPARMYWMKMVPPQHAQSPDFATRPVGTGPYVMSRWNRGNEILLERNPDYWGEAPQIEQVLYRFVGESGTRLSGLMAGEFDIITNLLPEFIGQVPQAAHVAGLELPIIILNTMEGVTADPRVRQALNYAVDKEALAEALFEGHAEVAQGQLLAPSFFGYNPAVTAYPYDPDKARALLAEAGAEGATVELVGTAGRWLKDRELVETVAAFWADVGLDTRVRIFEFGEYLNRLFDRQTRPPGVFVVSSNELLDADRPFTAYYHKGGSGASNDDARLAELVEQARVETDEAQRLALYHEAVQIAHDGAYFVWLLNIEDIYGLSERLRWQPRVDAKLLVKEMRVEG